MKWGLPRPGQIASKIAMLVLLAVLGKNFQVVINHPQPPMDNVKIRQALQYAIS